MSGACVTKEIIVDMIVQGMIAAATILWLLSYLKFRRVFAFAFIVDVIVTGGFIIMFIGTYAGMMTGVIAGLLVSMFMRVCRKAVGVERPRLRRQSGHVLPSLVWIRSKA